ncbi:hypothetical protein D9613_004350 [Agrocybe pediades]|uniref:VASt domain-containing protein n=1 Tax=Agrocybe pediades TaxID=84607 RepID=A0A8H4QJS8_9AGAR|nr:hypothetical protein D9613_004350 [Agrocybe pediades]
MAPNFFQKLVKVASPNTANSNPRERVSSEAYPSSTTVNSRSSSDNVSRSRAFSASAVSPTTPTQSSTFSSISRRTSSSGSDSRIPSIITTLSSGGRKRSKSGAKEKEKKKKSERSTSRSRETLQPQQQQQLQPGDRRSWGSVDTVSTQPNVTIVPPSPLVKNSLLDSDSDEEGEQTEHEQERETPVQIETPTEDTSATPTLQNQFAADDSKPMSNLTPSYQVRKQPSNRSIGKKAAPPPEINVAAAAATVANGASGSANSGNHIRSATAPPSADSAYASASEQLTNGSVTMKPIVESPTDLKFPTGENGSTIAPSSSTSTATSGGTSASASTANLSLQREGTTASVLSVGDGTKSKRPWRRSTTRKPTGLAGAIAASGLAMANPTMSAAQNAAMTTSPVLSATSPSRSSGDKDKDKQPYLSRSPAESSVSQHKKSRSAGAGDMSPRSSKSRKSSIGSPGRSSGRRTRRGSSAAHSDANSEYYASINGTSTTLNGDDNSARPEYYIGIGDESDSDDSDDSGSEGSSILDMDEEDIPVTGFAVASNKRNADFHELFPSIPEGDYLIEDYGCALQREILIQGRIYISENHICFHANIFGWITDTGSLHTLFALLSRSYPSITLSPPSPPSSPSVLPSSEFSQDSSHELTNEPSDPTTTTQSTFLSYVQKQLSIPIYEITSLEKKMTAFVIPNAIQITTRQAKYTFASFLSRDTTFDVIYNIWRLARPEDGASFLSSGRGSMEGAIGAPGGGAVGAGGPAATATGAAVAAPAANVLTRKATQCTCGKENKHFTETAMDTTFPGTPEKIHGLMFASGFIKDFMVGNQKLMDIQMSDWSPVTPGSKLLTRNFSYIKPLSGSLGPKQTKCELKDEVVFCDFDQYVSTMTTTRTPDVPSGGVFAVKTRTCITWASAISSRVVVTTQVEWTGRSFIKGIIERSAIDGQKVYHTELEKEMRSYIQAHKSEFLPEGVDAAAVAEPAPATGDAAAGTTATQADEKGGTTTEDEKRRERERNARGLQWAYDTFDGAWQVAKRSTKGALELVRDAWDQSSSTTILWFVIVLLVMSNVWTLLRSGRRGEKEKDRWIEVDRKIEVRRAEERERWVQSVVSALYEELAAKKEHGQQLPLEGQPSAKPYPSAKNPTSAEEMAAVPIGSVIPPPVQQSPEPKTFEPKEWREEVQALLQTLDKVEERVKALRDSLVKLDELD